MGCSKHTETFFWQNVLLFVFNAYEKYIFHHFKIFFTTICQYYLEMWFITIIHFKKSKKDPFKTYKKFQRPQNLRNVLKKIFAELFGYLNIDFICFYK